MDPALRGAAVIQDGQGRPPLQGRTGTVRSGTSRTPSPTHAVIARSEATRQSVLPSPKKRIPTPVCTPRALASRRALARNDSAPRWERRDTWVPPYGVRRSSRADRVVRPYKAEQEPCETERRGRRPLRWGTRTVRSGTSRTPSPTHSVIARSEATRQSVLPSPKRRIPAPVTRSLVRNDSAARRRDGGTHGSRPTGCGDHPGRAEASAPTRQNRNRAKRDVEDAVPYDGGHEPCEAGRRGRRALHTLSLRGAKRRGNPFSPAQRDGSPRQ